MNVRVVEGDLLDQDVDAIVNAWNRNIVPWWLLLPQGVSGALKRRAGRGVFREVARHGPIPLGQAVHTSAGDLPHRGIIHVAGIDMLWRSSERSIRDSVRSAVALAVEHGYRSVALPIIGAGSGGFDEARAEALILDTLGSLDADLDVLVVRFRPAPGADQPCTSKSRPQETTRSAHAPRGAGTKPRRRERGAIVLADRARVVDAPEDLHHRGAQRTAKQAMAPRGFATVGAHDAEDLDPAYPGQPHVRNVREVHIVPRPGRGP